MTEQSKGILYLVGTPLGNLEDITQRALRTLREVDLIAAEDTRHTLKLLNHFQIKKSLLSYYQHNERERSGQIIEKILAGLNVALVSDAGMPGISDPGELLVAAAIERGITVVPIPGITAAVTAIAASGLETSSFWFAGFLPRKSSEQLARLTDMSDFQGTLIFYEAPHRLLGTLKNIGEVFGERRIAVARELTKLHEEFIRGSLSEVIHELTGRLESAELKGEFTLVVEGYKLTNKNHQNSTKFDINDMLVPKKSDRSLRQELKEIARLTGKSTKEVYQLYLEHQKKEEG
jgi:probable S-adenosylmethionine-dependent methyltransferase, YraL family